MKISVLMPTLFPDLAWPAIEALRAQLAGVDHEFVLVSSARFEGEGIVWIEETAPRGVVAAMRMAAEHATGDVLLLVGDDVRFSPGAVGEVLAAFSEPARKFPLALTYPHRIGAIDCVFTGYGRLHPSFFATGREDARTLGGVFDTGFRQGWADPDYGMRVWKAGGTVRAARAHVRDLDDRKGAGEAARDSDATQTDWNRFRERWEGDFDPIWRGTVDDACQMIAAAALPALSPQAPDTLRVDGRLAARDLRIVRAMTAVAYHANAGLPLATIEAGLKYFGWAAKLSANPRQVQVAGFYWAGVVRADMPSP